jgi:predicted lipid-binding transport protein (Tim44 family)
MGPRAVLDAEVKRKIPSAITLSYPGSVIFSLLELIQNVHIFTNVLLILTSAIFSVNEFLCSQRTQDEIPSAVQFPCRRGQHADRVPTSVHRLRPQDIKVIAAMGDSITSANGAMANTEEETRYNYRGVSAMGGK